MGREYTEDFYEGGSLEEVAMAVKSVARTRIANDLYWKYFDEDYLVDLLLVYDYELSRDFFLERLAQITDKCLRAYLRKVSNLYKEEYKHSHEIYKIIDALLSIDSRATFFLGCYDFKDNLKFE